jgi:hypothetical protein
MPSSLIFTGLVVVWLLILVPAVARHQQEVAHLSDASLAGRVLARPRRRGERRLEGHPIEEDSVDDDGIVGTRPKEVWVPTARKAAQRVDVAVPAQSRWDAAEESEAELDAEPDAEPDLSPDADSDDDGWERPAPRYRPGRGGFDPDADAASARRRYAFRQRVVLALLVCALLTAVVAAAAVKVVWWAHAGIDLVLVSYLVYLRRQVREEADIRERRVARMAGTRRTSAADDHELDEWARRGREATRRPVADAEEPAESPSPAEATAAEDDAEDSNGLVDELGDELAEDGDAARVRGVGEPVGLLPARRRGADADAEPESALPPLRPAPPPPLPPGTSLVEVDDDDLDLHDLGAPGHPHRRAVGQ